MTEIIVIGFTDMDRDSDPMSVLRIDVKERLANPLDKVIEPEIGRAFGILISEDDFSRRELLIINRHLWVGKKPI